MACVDRSARRYVSNPSILQTAYTEDRGGKMESDYKVDENNRVIGPGGDVFGEFGEDFGQAEAFAAFLNEGDAKLQAVIDFALEANVGPISGAQWARIQREWKNHIQSTD